MTETVNFGEHLTIDGYDGDYDKLNDKDLVLKALSELPEKLGMTPMIEPVIKEAEDNGIKDPGGWSGFVMILESHISIHTFPGRHFVSADVYTCKNGMQTDFILEYFKEVFGLGDIEHQLIKRGTEYPAHNLTHRK